MKKSLLTFILVFIACFQLRAQFITSVVKITTTYSANGKFYIKCIPYDNEEPSLKGKATVYNSAGKLLYIFNRNFNGLRESSDFLAISNDGQTILYGIEVYANEKVDGLHTVSIYKAGKLVKSYTLLQATGCDVQAERCSLIYVNYDKVIDRQKSNVGSPAYKKVYKDTVSEEERFLSDYAAVAYDDTVYITDSKRVTHVFDLKTTNIVASVGVDTIYPKLKNLPLKQLTVGPNITAPYAKDKSFFPNLLNGDTTGIELAKYIGMKAVRLGNPDYQKYKIYQIRIKAYITRDGKITIDDLDVDKGMPAEKIREFFNANRYDVSFIPKELDVWYFTYFFWGFRNLSDQQALMEKDEDLKQRALERQQRLSMDSINHVYIPRNLEECFVGLDKELSPVIKTEMRNLKSSGAMTIYHLGLGTWMRNNWGLWGGSRLWVYFESRGITNPEGMSSVVLTNYYAWLHHDDSWMEFELQHPPKK